MGNILTCSSELFKFYLLCKLEASNVNKVFKLLIKVSILYYFAVARFSDKKKEKCRFYYKLAKKYINKQPMLTEYILL